MKDFVFAKILLKGEKQTVLTFDFFKWIIYFSDWDDS